MAYKINDDKCIGCGMCEENCPANAIEYLGEERFKINEDACVGCGTCEEHCFAGAIVKE